MIIGDICSSHNVYHGCGSLVHMLISHALIVDVPDHAVVDSEEPVRQRDSVITWSVPAESDSDGEGDGVSVIVLCGVPEIHYQDQFYILFLLFFSLPQSHTHLYLLPLTMINIPLEIISDLPSVHI